MVAPTKPSEKSGGFVYTCTMTPLLRREFRDGRWVYVSIASGDPWLGDESLLNPKLVDGYVKPPPVARTKTGRAFIKPWPVQVPLRLRYGRRCYKSDIDIDAVTLALAKQFLSLSH